MEVANNEYHNFQAYVARNFFQHDLVEGADDGSHVNHFTDPNKKVLRLGYVLNTYYIHYFALQNQIIVKLSVSNLSNIFGNFDSGENLTEEGSNV